MPRLDQDEDLQLAIALSKSLMVRIAWALWSGPHAAVLRRDLTAAVSRCAGDA